MFWLKLFKAGINNLRSIYVTGFLYNTGFYKMPRQIIELLKILKFLTLPNLSQANNRTLKKNKVLRFTEF